MPYSKTQNNGDKNIQHRWTIMMATFVLQCEQKVPHKSHSFQREDFQHTFNVNANLCKRRSLVQSKVFFQTI